MRTKRWLQQRQSIFTFLLILILLTSLVACASFEKNAYRSLTTAKPMINITVNGLDELYAKKLITTEQYKDNMKLAKAFSQAYIKAVDLFALWKKTHDAKDKDKLIIALSESISYLTVLSANEIVNMIKDFKEAFKVLKLDYEKIKK